MSGSQENLKSEYALNANQHIGTNLKKVCFKCLEEKPIDEFYKHPRMADGYLGKCKECTKKDTKDNIIKNHEYYVEYDRLRAMLPHRVEARNKYSKTLDGLEAGNRAKRKWKDNNPEKRKCSQMLNNAVRDGRVMKPESCSVCSSKKRIHGHHFDYSKPLDVVWVCAACHRKIHCAITGGKT